MQVLRMVNQTDEIKYLGSKIATSSNNRACLPGNGREVDDSAEDNGERRTGELGKREQDGRTWTNGSLKRRNDVARLGG